MSAHPSVGEGGVYDAWSDFEGDSSAKSRVGTRVCGVVRVCAQTADEGMRRLTSQLTQALHDAKPEVKPPTILEKANGVPTKVTPKNLKRMGLYDVMWQEQLGSDGGGRGVDGGHASRLTPPKLTRSNSLPLRAGGRQSSGSGAGSPRSPPLKAAATVSSPRGTPQTRSSFGAGSPASQREAFAALAAAPPSSPDTALKAASKRSPLQSSVAAALSLEPRAGAHHRPLLSNPHASLLLDVHTRLLRTSGSSFSYMSGRTQLDTSLPWIGIGREERAFEEDRKLFAKTVRPLSPRPLSRYSLSEKAASAAVLDASAAAPGAETETPLWYVPPGTPLVASTPLPVPSMMADSPVPHVPWDGLLSEGPLEGGFDLSAAPAAAPAAPAPNAKSKLLEVTL